MMGWIPWTRDEAETLYMYQVKLRRPCKASTSRRDSMAGTSFAREQSFG